MESAPAAGPYPKVHQKFIKNRIRKKLRFLIPNGLPKGPSKSQKSHQISKMAPSNTFGELLWPLSFQKGFPSRSQGPQNVKNDSFTIVKPLFSEIHSSLKMITFGHLFGPFWDHFGHHGLPNGAQSAKKEPFKK